MQRRCEPTTCIQPLGTAACGTKVILEIKQMGASWGEGNQAQERLCFGYSGLNEQAPRNMSLSMPWRFFPHQYPSELS